MADYGQDNGAAYGMMLSANRRAGDWETYAHELEQRLVNSQAEVAAIRTLAATVIKELSRIDPKNYLAVRENRQKIVDDAYAQAGKRKA
jgi:hypothetical protein